MSEKVHLSDFKCLTKEYDIATSSNGTILKAHCSIADAKIVYHVLRKDNNVIELFDTLGEAIKQYNASVE